ncbi:RHS repeat-associated protein [Catenulispora sp. MAP5-51]|uniref:RHS repeat-associated core domain-containing protein n=1 Tax=Catenulispora sp. MAP5-51 TaxID=3156298 RepID=UPI003514794F
MYDSLGRAIQTYTSVHVTTAPGGAPQSLLDSQLASNTVTSYDGMSRPLTATVYNGATAVAGDVTTTAYPGLDRTDVTAPAGNGVASAGATSTFTDVRGRTTALWTYHNNPPSPDGNARDADVTSYGFSYVTNGTQSTVTDATGRNTWTTTTNDLLGHSTTAVDPNAGTSSTQDDNNGNLIQSTNADGQTLSFYYDTLNRKYAEYNAAYVAGGTPASAALMAQWTFDSASSSDGHTNLGMPVDSTRYTDSGTTPYKQAVTGYNTAGEPLGAIMTIPNADNNGALAGTYQTNDYYTPITGQLYHTELPAVGGLPSDDVYNSYNANGLLLSTAGNYDYIWNTVYDTNGNLLTRTLGDYPYQIVQQNLYDPATNRITNSFTDASAGQNAANPTTVNAYSVDDVSYTYDAAGQITSVADLQNQSSSGYDPGPAARDIQCYTYDYAGRLTNAWADSGDQTPAATTNLNSPSAVNGGLGSCADSTSNNPPATGTTSALGGPAPYWQTYGFDNTGAAGLGNGSQTGNRSTLIDHATTAGGTDTTSTSSYPTAGTSNTTSTPGTGPHLLSQVTQSGGATGTSQYKYDNAGNTISRNPVNAGAETLQWDAEGRLQTDAAAANPATNTPQTTTNYLYDASGDELIRRDSGGANAGTTLYLGATELHLNAAGNTVTANRYYSYPGAPEIIASSSGALTYEIGNSQGTGGTTLDATTNHITARRYTTPYGTPRGQAAATTFGIFPDDHTFLGKTSDTSTGLVDVGARKYDPTSGRFISADPVFQPANPQAIGGYAYSSDDPVNGSDPSGLKALDDDGNAAPPPPRSTPWPSSTPPPPAAVSTCDQKCLAGIAARAQYTGQAGNYWNQVWNSSDPTSIPPPPGVVMPKLDKGTDWSIVAATAIVGVIVAASIAAMVSECEGFSLGAATTACTGAAIGAADAVGCAFSICPRPGNEGQGTDPSGGFDSAPSRLGTLCGHSHSFAGDTRVKMADGTTELISEVKVGDEIENAQPGGGTEDHRVSEIHKTLTDRNFTDLTVSTPTGLKVITGTQNHPYYDLTTGRFTDASQLKPGDRLQSDGSAVVIVSSVRNYTSSMVTYDLTIKDLHTYYVVAGDAAILVHNDACEILPSKVVAKYAVLGAQDDTEIAKDWADHEVLALPAGWDIEANKEWIAGVITKKQIVFYASNLTNENLWNAQDLRVTVTALEVGQLMDAGYTFVGTSVNPYQYMVPPGWSASGAP